MSKIQRYGGNFPPFARDFQSQERTSFGTEDVGENSLDGNINDDWLRGWGIISPSEFPPIQYFNALGFTLSQTLAYLHQQGVPEWNAAQEYFTGSLAQAGGRLYIAQTGTDVSPNVGNDPETDDGTNWEAMPSAAELASAPDITDTSTDTYEMSPGRSVAVGETVRGKVLSANESDTPTLDNTDGDDGALPVVTREDGALWPGALLGFHTFEKRAGSWRVQDPVDDRPKLYGMVNDPTELLLATWKRDDAAGRPRGDRTALVDNLVADLQAASLWSKLDFLYVFAQFEERNGLYDLKSPSRSLPATVNDPVFITDEGYEGDGVDAHLELGFNRQDLSQFSRDDAHMGAFVLKDVDETGSVIGAAAGGENDAFIKPRDGGVAKARLNTDGTVISASVPSADGSFIITRSASDSSTLYRNGEQIATSTEASTELDAAEFTVLEANDQFSTQTVAAVHGGGALTGGEVETLYFILAAYLQEVGAI